MEKILKDRESGEERKCGPVCDSEQVYAVLGCPCSGAAGILTRSLCNLCDGVSPWSMFMVLGLYVHLVLLALRSLYFSQV